MIILSVLCTNVFAMPSENLASLCAEREDRYQQGLCDGLIVATLQGAYRGVAEQAAITETPMDRAAFQRALPVCMPDDIPQETVVNRIRNWIAAHTMMRRELDGPSLILHAYQRVFPCVVANPLRRPNLRQ
jgi:hypothetical protein